MSDSAHAESFASVDHQESAPNLSLCGDGTTLRVSYCVANRRAASLPNAIAESPARRLHQNLGGFARARLAWFTCPARLESLHVRRESVVLIQTIHSCVDL